MRISNTRIRIGAASALAAVLVAGPAVTATAAPAVPLDEFHTAPADIADLRPGAVVATQQLNLPAYPGADVWQISYRTADERDRPEMTVTTLLVPDSPWTGPGARPVVSLEQAEDSSGAQCAPSVATATGNDFLSHRFVQHVLDRNWAVAMPDFEGPRSLFMVGAQSAHAVLDGIRAVRNAGIDDIGADNPWALEGYSGGAGAAGWAAQAQPGYAPDITFAGVAVGGMPADPQATAEYLDGGPFAGLVFAALSGVSDEYPEAGIPELLNAQGTADLENSRNRCARDLIAQFAFRSVKRDAAAGDPLTAPDVAAVLAQSTMGATAPAAPVYDYHAIPDEVVPVGQDDTLTRNWCAAGGTVLIDRDPEAEHVSESMLRETEALDYLADRFAGIPAPSSC
ncbi:lipase family protein [Nocardia stercoris]|uniref:Triacylglycerol lipase n=1 Tax=Nocardia stercoris TaxID=2483361 RepID=A0A3M2L4X9_9NOCA|nr:lipase family protein [Nocardia stercoris]RMI32742.1 triacylglycerol lipase [Nocardia stercoris]